MKKYTIAIIIFWFLTVCIYVFLQESVYLIGKDAVLETIPADPRDLLRGDYVRLKFNITNVDDYSVPRNYRQTLYVVLELDKDNIAHIKKVQTQKPKNEFFMKGKLDPVALFSRKEIKYGIESYFVKSKEAKRLEKELSGKCYAKVKIDRFGRAKIISIGDKL